MADNLFILGAGASFDAGAPLMTNFMDKAAELLRNRNVDTYEDDFKLVFDVVKQLRLVYANSHLDLHNIEALFGAIEMGAIINILGSRTDNDIVEARRALIRLIVTTLENSILYYSYRGEIRPTDSYNKLVELIKDKLKDTAIITFNYDIALDIALLLRGVAFSYCTDTSSNGIKLMKLHGSVNWTKCKKCGTIIPYDIWQFIRDRSTRFLPAEDKGAEVPLKLSQHLKDLKHETCGECEDVPVIVPPTWNKTDYHGSLTNVWKHAAQEIQKARNIYIMGYSLPESDAFFRYLFALGAFDNDRIEKFWVYNPDKSGATKERYLSLIGQGIKHRFDYKELTFDKGIDDLNKAAGNGGSFFYGHVQQ